MTEIIPRQLPTSLGGLAAGFMAAQLLSPVVATTPQWQDRGNLVLYAIPGIMGTHGEHGSLFAVAGFARSSAVETSIVSFYSTLLAKQERLGSEFEKRLSDNLWDLYAR
jgi:hypothetical protein